MKHFAKLKTKKETIMFSSIQKCQLIGYLFLISITSVESILFCNILNVNSIERIMAVVIIAAIFNLSIWYFAAKYQTIKRTLNKNDKSN